MSYSIRKKGIIVAILLALGVLVATWIDIITQDNSKVWSQVHQTLPKD